MDFQNIVIAHHHINLVRAIKDYHIRHYIWEVAKVLIPVFITGFITVIVMRTNDNRNKKRWLNDSFIKHQNDLILKINKILLDFSNKFDNHFNIFENTPVKIGSLDSFFNEYGEELSELSYSYRELFEVYKIEVKPLSKALFELDYVKNYVKENIENPDKLTIILQDGTEVDIDDCLQDLSSDFVKSRSEMIKVIQKKLK